MDDPNEPADGGALSGAVPDAHPPSGTLSAAHRAMLKESGISDEVIRERGYRTITDKAELLALGFAEYQALVPCLLVPIHGPSGEIGGYHIRPDKPRKRNNGKVNKYEFPAGCQNRLDVPPRVRSVLGNPKVPIWITEGSKKADSAVSQGLHCLALIGVWNYRGKNTEGGSTVLGDFEQVAWNGREVNIAFDSDAVSKPAVRAAEKRLAGLLKSRKARVRIVRIPPGQNGEKVGLDDYLAAGGTIDELRASTDLEVESPEKGRPDPAAQLIQLTDRLNVELWHGADGEGYASFQNGSGPTHTPIGSRALASYLSSLFYKDTGRALSEGTLSVAISILEARAKFDGPEYPVERRVGWLDDRIYLALHDQGGNVVEISAGDWRVIEGAASPIRFVRPPSARALPRPARSGSLADLQAFVNVRSADWQLVEAFLIGCFLPAGTFAVLAGTGEQGTGKSFGIRTLHELIDPSLSPLRAMPKDHKALMAALNSGYLLSFDNLSRITPEMSDSLCRIVSGTGLAERTLYTNAEETIVVARRPILLNGIGDVVTRPDLADRSLLVQFQRLEGERRSEQALVAEFERNKAGILGDLLDRVARALAHCKSTVPPDIRLHDFGQFVLASAKDEAQAETLRAALMGNRAELQAAAIDYDEFAQAVVGLVEDAGVIEETASEILAQVNSRRGDGQAPEGWPRNGEAVAKRLARLAPVLRSQGIEVVRMERKARARPWRLSKSGTEPSLPSSGDNPLPSNTDGRDPGADSSDDGKDDGRAGGSNGLSANSHSREVQAEGPRPALHDGHDGSDGSAASPSLFEERF